MINDHAANLCDLALTNLCDLPMIGWNPVSQQDRLHIVQLDLIKIERLHRLVLGKKILKICI